MFLIIIAKIPIINGRNNFVIKHMIQSISGRTKNTFGVNLFKVIHPHGTPAINKAARTRNAIYLLDNEKPEDPLIFHAIMKNMMLIHRTVTTFLSSCLFLASVQSGHKTGLYLSQHS